MCDSATNGNRRRNCKPIKRLTASSPVEFSSSIIGDVPERAQFPRRWLEATITNDTNTRERLRAVAREMAPARCAISEQKRRELGEEELRSSAEEPLKAKAHRETTRHERHELF